MAAKVSALIIFGKKDGKAAEKPHGRASSDIFFKGCYSFLTSHWYQTFEQEQEALFGIALCSQQTRPGLLIHSLIGLPFMLVETTVGSATGSGWFDLSCYLSLGMVQTLSNSFLFHRCVNRTRIICKETFAKARFTIMSLQLYFWRMMFTSAVCMMLIPVGLAGSSKVMQTFLLIREARNIFPTPQNGKRIASNRAWFGTHQVWSESKSTRRMILILESSTIEIGMDICLTPEKMVSKKSCDSDRGKDMKRLE